jgi:hypothetical protein
MGCVRIWVARPTRRLAAATLTAALMACIAPQMAHASTASVQPGVHVDPGSPAGKEYQFPVTGARSETAGSGQQSGSIGPPLFGVGVTPATAATGSTSTTSAQSATSNSKRPGSRSGATAGGANAAALARAGSRPEGAGSTSSQGSAGGSAEGLPVAAGTQSGGAGASGWIPLAVGGLLVLVLGGGGGLMLRQRVLRG